MMLLGSSSAITLEMALSRWKFPRLSLLTVSPRHNDKIKEVLDRLIEDVGKLIEENRLEAYGVETSFLGELEKMRVNSKYREILGLYNYSPENAAKVEDFLKILKQARVSIEKARKRGIAIRTDQALTAQQKEDFERLVKADEEILLRLIAALEAHFELAMKEAKLFALKTLSNQLEKLNALINDYIQIDKRIHEDIKASVQINNKVYINIKSVLLPEQDTRYQACQISHRAYLDKKDAGKDTSFEEDKQAAQDQAEIINIIEIAREKLVKNGQDVSELDQDISKLQGLRRRIGNDIKAKEEKLREILIQKERMHILRDYSAAPMSELNGKEPTEQGRIYLEFANENSISYKMLGADGNVKTGSITMSELVAHGGGIHNPKEVLQLPQELQSQALTSRRVAILEIMAERELARVDIDALKARAPSLKELQEEASTEAKKLEAEIAVLQEKQQSLHQELDTKTKEKKELRGERKQIMAKVEQIEAAKPEKKKEKKEKEESSPSPKFGR